MGKNIKRFSILTALSGLALIANQLYAADSKSTHTSWLKTEVIEDRGGQSIDHYMPKNKKSEERMKESLYSMEARVPPAGKLIFQTSKM